MARQTSEQTWGPNKTANRNLRLFFLSSSNSYHFIHLFSHSTLRTPSMWQKEYSRVFKTKDSAGKLLGFRFQLHLQHDQLLNFSVPLFLNLPNGDHHSNYIIGLNELIYIKHMKQSLAHAHTIWARININQASYTMLGIQGWLRLLPLRSL